jgi:hypothetical protein
MYNEYQYQYTLQNKYFRGAASIRCSRVHSSDPLNSMLLLIHNEVTRNYVQFRGQIAAVETVHGETQHSCSRGAASNMH